MTQRKTSARIAAVIAAAAMTALTFGGQFGLASHCDNTKADALIVAKRSAQPVQINGDALPHQHN